MVPLNVWLTHFAGTNCHALFCAQGNMLTKNMFDITLAAILKSNRKLGRKTGLGFQRVRIDNVEAAPNEFYAKASPRTT